jgi:hypothetical protein
LVGLASGIDCTTWSSADSGIARDSVSARTARKASRQNSQRSRLAGVDEISRRSDEVADGMQWNPCYRTIRLWRIGSNTFTGMADRRFCVN